MKKIVLCTGGYDPLHSGHLSYFNEAKKLGDKLIVGVNSDEWLERKKGKAFMPMHERVSIIRNLSMVDGVCPVINDDVFDDAGGAIFHVLSTHGDIELIVANGGDRKFGSVPEEEKWGSYPGIKFVYGIGGNEKKNSSSWILKEWSHPTTKRAWGSYTVLDSGDGWKTKLLSFDVGKSLSDQRHFKRSEHWHVVEGNLQMDLEYSSGYKTSKIYSAGESIDIPPLTWHKASNVGSKEVKIIEVWLGKVLSEDDIERQ